MASNGFASLLVPGCSLKNNLPTVYVSTCTCMYLHVHVCYGLTKPTE